MIVVDDHAVVREGLRLLLSGRDEFEWAGEADSAEAGIQLVTSLKPEALIMDLQLPDRDGYWLLQGARRAVPDLRVLVLTMHRSKQRVKQALEAGAQAYLHKSSSFPEVLRALTAIRAGQRYLCPKLAAEVVDPEPEQTLSTRELEILGLAAQGLDTDAIALALHVSTNTVKTYWTRVFRKLGSSSRVQAVAEAIRRGLLELGPG